MNRIASLNVTEFVHLRLHSEYSLNDGLLRMKPLIKAVAERGMAAVAVTDHSNFFGLVKFHKAALAQGVKPIYGADLMVRDADGSACPLCLLVMNDEGYQNLTELISRAFLEGRQHDGPTVERAWLEGQSAGLIALSGGLAGDVGTALLKGREDLARERLQAWMTLFPSRFYVELHRTGREGEEAYLHAAVALASTLDCPVVATNDVRFLDSGEFEAHEARVCIAEHRVLDDRRRLRRYSSQQYLRSPAEMQLLFSDLPEALANTVAIAQRCNLQLELGKVCLPDYPVPEGMSMEEFFREVAAQGLDERLAVILDGVEAAQRKAETQRYRERLDFELDTIIQMGFPGYFLIVMDFIRWAKQHGIPVGPGRGSGAGSLVAYSLEITDLDPHAVRPAVRAISSTRSGSPCRTSTSTSAWSAATRSSTTWRTLRARGCVADHHLRHAGGQGGGARRGPGAGQVLRPWRQAVEDDSLRSGYDAGQGPAAGGGARVPQGGRARPRKSGTWPCSSRA